MPLLLHFPWALHWWQDKVQHLYLGICKTGPNLPLMGHFLPFSPCTLCFKHSTFPIPNLHGTATARVLDLCTGTQQLTNPSLPSNSDSLITLSGMQIRKSGVGSGNPIVSQGHLRHMSFSSLPVRPVLSGGHFCILPNTAERWSPVSVHLWSFT